MHLALVSDSLHEIKFSEEPEDLPGRRAAYITEAQMLGGDWRVVTSEEAFHFPTAEEIAAEELAAKVARVKGELASLDASVPRIVEDMIPLVPGLVVDPTKAAVIARKIELRAELAGLGG